jgi:hypothetical protein
MLKLAPFCIGENHRSQHETDREHLSRLHAAILCLPYRRPYEVNPETRAPPKAWRLAARIVGKLRLSDRVAEAARQSPTATSFRPPDSSPRPFRLLAKSCRSKPAS